MIATSLMMFVENEIDILRVDVATLSCTRLAQRLAYLIPKLVIDPLLDWYSESLLGSIENLRGDQISRDALQEMLCFHACQFQRRRNGGDEIDQLVVQQRHPHFERRRHAHAIDFRKNVSGQVSLAVYVKQLIAWLVCLYSTRVLAETARHLILGMQSFLEVS